MKTTFAALSRGPFTTLIVTRLYLPSKWIDDKARCDAVEIPTESQHFKTKPELALEMIQHSRKFGERYSWVRYKLSAKQVLTNIQ